MEPRRVGRSNTLPLDPFTHPEDLARPVEREILRVRKILCQGTEPPPQSLVARDEPGPQQRLELPGLRVSLQVFEVCGKRACEGPGAALRPEAGVGLPPAPAG